MEIPSDITAWEFFEWLPVNDHHEPLKEILEKFLVHMNGYPDIPTQMGFRHKAKSSKDGRKEHD